MHISDRALLAPEIKVKELFHGEWYDGPIWGICEYRDERLAYVFTNIDEEKNRRIYAVVRLEKELIERIVREKWTSGDVSAFDPFEDRDLGEIEIIGRFEW